MKSSHYRCRFYSAFLKTEICRRSFYTSYKKFFVFNLILLILFLSSCATKPRPPINKFVRLGSTYEERIPQVKNIGIINDVCLVRDAVGSDDYFSIDDSKLAESFMLEGAKVYLEQKGYQVDFQFSPFVCAFKTPEKEFKVADKKGTEVSDRHSPFFTSESLSDDKAYKQTLINAIRQVQLAVEQKQNAPSGIVSFNEKTQKSLKLIAEHTKTETVFFIVGNGVVVPGGKSFGQAVATGVATGVLTLGMVTYSKYDVSYLDTYVGLVDLKNGNMLWSNSFRRKQINPTKQDFYLTGWAKTALYYIPTKESPPQTNKSNAKSK